MTQHELLRRLLLLSRDLEANSMLFRTRVRHQRRFYREVENQRAWILYGMLTYYRDADLEAMGILLREDPQLIEFVARNAQVLEADRPDITISTLMRRLGELRDLAAPQCVLAVTTPFVTVMAYFRNVNVEGILDAVS